MIYILSGSDIHNKNIYTKELTNKKEIFFVSSGEINKNLIMSYATNISLFNESPVVVIENIFKKEDMTFSSSELAYLKESKTIFVFQEDKLLLSDQKKYQKYGEIKIFEEKKKNINQKFNIFSLTDAFANRDKITTWILYHKGIEEGVEPEAIAGVLFWKIKTMILNGNRFFSKEELKNNSSLIVYLYHKAHRGEFDFYIGIEQFILNSLSSK